MLLIADLLWELQTTISPSQCRACANFGIEQVHSTAVTGKKSLILYIHIMLMCMIYILYFSKSSTLVTIIYWVCNFVVPNTSLHVQATLILSTWHYLCNNMYLIFLTRVYPTAICTTSYTQFGSTPLIVYGYSLESVEHFGEHSAYSLEWSIM